MGTVAWKGSQANDPIQSTGWSADPLAADGYFQNYKPYQNGAVKAFDRTKNRIDANMRVRVTNNPIGYHTTVNKCNEDVTYTDVPPDPAHGIVWSNHFCGAGWAWEQQTNKPLPARTSDTCGDDYYTEMTGSCGSTPDLLPVADPDGCAGLFRQPLDANETVESYHDELVPLLETADAAHAADLSYDGYWSMAYQAWEQWRESRAIDSVIELTPPNNYFCANVRWWGKNEQNGSVSENDLSIYGTSMLNGTCTVRFNPKKYSNLLVMELGKKPVDESCTVQLENPYTNPNVLSSNISVNKKSDFVAHVTGYSTEPTPPNKEKVNLWVANDDFTQINAWSYTNALGQRTILDGKFVEVFSGGKYYYKHDDPTALNQQCYTNADGACSMSVNITDSTMALFNQDILPDDTYSVFCDVVEPSSVCSGNPACTMNGGSLACSGYNDCTPDTSTPNDHATATVSCLNPCNNVCGAPGYTDSCGNTCGAGAEYGAPPAPTIAEPTPSDVVTPGSFGAPANHYNIQWSNASALTESFDILAYPQNLTTALGNAATPDDALALYGAGGHATVIYYSNQLVSVSTLNIPVLSGQNWKMRLAMRAKNSGPCTPMNSGWTVVDFDLIGSISGDVQAVSGNQCSGGTRITTAGLPDLQTGTTISVSDEADRIVSFTSTAFGKGFGLSNLVNGQYSANFFPYSPTTWFNPGPMKVRLNLVNPDLSQAYVCAACNRETPGNVFTCINTDVSVPATGENFYVQLLNLSNSPWWQAWGGNLFGKNGITSNSPATCTSGVGCIRTLIANLTGQTNSAGVPVSTQAIQSTGGYYSDNTTAGGGNPYAQNTTTSFSPTLENYSYFLVNVDVPVPATPTGGATQISANVRNVGELQAAFGSNYRDLGSNGEKVVWVGSDLTVNLGGTSGKWDVPTGERWVVFVPGNLTFTGPTSDHLPATQQGLIKVASGGFLAFIARGNITFNSDLGYGYDDETSVASFTTPIVEGVYIASSNLVVQSKNAASSTPGDYKFVGAGTFVGWSAVNLERKFDDGGTRNALNNDSPTDLFIYRPDFMINAPQFLQKATVDWKEVN